MGQARKKSNSESNTVKLVMRIVLFSSLAVMLVLALIDYYAKNNAVKTAEAWLATLVEFNESGKDLIQEDLDKLTEGNPSIEDVTAGAGQEIKLFTWSRILGDDYQIKVTYDMAVKPSVAEIDPLW